MPNLERLFSLAGAVVTPGWLLLIFVPRWKWSQRFTTLLVPTLLAPLYGFLLIHAPHIEGGGFATLAQVGRLFASPEILLAGWVHYLMIDLFTGAWEARDAVQLGLPRWVVAPCLLVTFLFGPLGLLLYLVLRLVMRKRLGTS